MRRATRVRALHRQREGQPRSHGVRVDHRQHHQGRADGVPREARAVDQVRNTEPECRLDAHARPDVRRAAPTSVLARCQRVRVRRVQRPRSHAVARRSRRHEERERDQEEGARPSRDRRRQRGVAPSHDGRRRRRGHAVHPQPAQPAQPPVQDARVRRRVQRAARRRPHDRRSDVVASAPAARLRVPRSRLAARRHGPHLVPRVPGVCERDRPRRLGVPPRHWPPPRPRHRHVPGRGDRALARRVRHRLLADLSVYAPGGALRARPLGGRARRRGRRPLRRRARRGIRVRDGRPRHAGAHRRGADARHETTRRPRWDDGRVGPAGHRRRVRCVGRVLQLRDGCDARRHARGARDGGLGVPRGAAVPPPPRRHQRVPHAAPRMHGG